jgi:hypothetical protein
MAEGVLGDYFYDFIYEVESVIVGGPFENRYMVKNSHIDNSIVVPSPKIARTDRN